MKIFLQLSFLNLKTEKYLVSARDFKKQLP